MTTIDAWIALAALCGVGIGWDRVRAAPRAAPTAGARLVVLAWLALVAWGRSDSWRGFAYVLLMPIGSYKIGDIAGYWLAMAWPAPGRRDRWPPRGETR